MECCRYCRGQKARIYHCISLAPRSHSLACMHTLSRSIPVGGQNLFLIHAALHNSSLHCVGYRQCTRSHTQTRSNRAPSEGMLSRRGPETYCKRCSSCSRRGPPQLALWRGIGVYRWPGHRFLPRSELNVCATSSLSVANRELTPKASDWKRSASSMCTPCLRKVTTHPWT